jgi:hypothetical protein
MCDTYGLGLDFVNRIYGDERLTWLDSKRYQMSCQYVTIVVVILAGDNVK